MNWIEARGQNRNIEAILAEESKSAYRSYLRGQQSGDAIRKRLFLHQKEGRNHGCFDRQQG